MAKILKAVLLLGIIFPALLPAQGIYRSRRGVAPGTPIPGAYKLSKKEIMLETDDDQTVSIRRSGKTKFLKGTQSIKASDIDLETLVTVDASEDADLKLTAISVTVDPPPKSADAK
jgi:hypothetical protein